MQTLGPACLDHQNLQWLHTYRLYVPDTDLASVVTTLCWTGLTGRGVRSDRSALCTERDWTGLTDRHKRSDRSLLELLLYSSDLH